jgi:hypothetical protein
MKWDMERKKGWKWLFNSMIFEGDWGKEKWGEKRRKLRVLWDGCGGEMRERKREWERKRGRGREDSDSLMDSSCADGLWERRKENEIETERENEIEREGGRKSWLCERKREKERKWVRWEGKWERGKEREREDYYRD